MTAKSIIRFLVYSNLYIALGGISLIYFSLRTVGFPSLSLPFITFIFGAIALAYSIQRSIGTKYQLRRTSIAVDYIRLHKKTNQFFLIVIGLSTTISFCYLHTITQLFAALLLLLSLMYVVKIRGKSLRQIPFAKVFIVALVWSFTTAILPSIHSAIIISHYLSLAILIFLLVFAETLLFDWRDRFQDAEIGLKTIANTLGFVRTKRLALLLCIVCSVLGILLLADLDSKIIWVITNLYLALCLLRLKRLAKDLYYSFIIETTLVIPGLLAYLHDNFLS